MVFEDNPVLYCTAYKKLNFRSFNFEEFVSFKKWSKFAYKNGVLEGQSDARISNTRAVENLCLLYLSITPPNVSMMLARAYSVDLLPLTFLTFCPVFCDNHSY